MEQSADQTDLNIISALRPSPRMTNKEVAEQLDLAETTVSQRIKLMAERNVMRVVVQKHIFSDGIDTIHLMFVNTSGSTVQKVSSRIAALEGVFGVTQGIGNPDIFVTARTRSLADALQLSNAIRAIDGVSTVEVSPCLHIHKYESKYGDLSTPSLPPASANPKDDAVIHAFMRDGRQSYREVARQLGLTEGAIRQRVNKLLRSGQIQFQVVVDPAAVSLGTVALIRIATLSNYTREVLDKLTHLEEAPFVAEVAGQYNVFALTTNEDTLTLGNFCDNELLTMRGVHALDVQLQVATTTHQYQLSYFDNVAT
ncbi:MAG: AsnC family transcriptional regulator [Pseudomonadota bacterium]